MKYYHMIIEKEAAPGIDTRHTRREYISPRQGAHPAGWRVVGVCGYHEETKKERGCKTNENNYF